VDADGGVWFLTANGGDQIERLNPSTGEVDAKESVTGSPIFISPSGDHVWIGTYQGQLIRFDIAPSE
jgi:streptogramin lyase